MCQNNMKEVYFSQYCHLCVSARLNPYKEPCFSCIEKPVRKFSHKPINFKPAKNTSEKKHTNKKR